MCTGNVADDSTTSGNGLTTGTDVHSAPGPTKESSRMAVKEGMTISRSLLRDLIPYAAYTASTLALTAWGSGALSGALA